MIPLRTYLLSPFLLLLAALPLRGADHLVQLDGSAADAEVTAITPAGQVRTAGEALAPIDLQALRRIERPAPATPGDPSAKPGAIVFLVGGGAILARNVAVHDQAAVIEWAYGKDLTLPMDQLRALVLQPPSAARPGAGSGGGADPVFRLRDEFRQALDSAEPAATDTLFALRDAKLQPVPGLLQELTAEHVTFVWDRQPRSIERAKVYGIVMAQVGAAPDHVGQGLVTLRDGSALWGKVVELRDGVLTLQITPDRPVTSVPAAPGNPGAAPPPTPTPPVRLALPWSEVVRLDLRSERLVFLADLQPVEVIEEALVTYPGPWRRNRSVTGGPLVLGEQTFDSGLGVHARCVLTFDAGGKFDAFAATIGIDASTLPKDKGDCEFAVLGDGQELFRRRVRRADAPRPVRVKIAGVKRVTLVVDPGEDLDLADHGDWCDARLLKER